MFELDYIVVYAQRMDKFYQMVADHDLLILVYKFSHKKNDKRRRVPYLEYLQIVKVRALK